MTGHLSASFSATLRVHVPDAPGRSRGSPRRSATPVACSARSTSSASSQAEGPRRHRGGDATPITSSGSPTPFARSTASRSSTSPTAPSCSTSAERSRCAPKSPIRTRDDLSMAYTPGVARISRRDRGRPGRGVDAHVEAEHGRGRHRRNRGARAREHRPGGGAPGDGRQGGALQGVRRRRRVADLPRDHGSRRDRRGRARRSRRGSAGSTSRTSPPRAASRSSAASARSSSIPVFHDDQHGTAIVVLAALAERAPASSARTSRTRAS